VFPLRDTEILEELTKNDNNRMLSLFKIGLNLCPLNKIYCFQKYIYKGNVHLFIFIGAVLMNASFQQGVLQLFDK